MKALRAIGQRFLGFFGRERREQEFNDELASHVEMQTDDNVRAGMSPEEARRQAILKLGGLEHTRQAYRERGSLPFLESLEQDLRFAARQFTKNRAFAVTALVVLSLGIGATSAIFAFVDAALIRPLPYRDPNRLVFVTEKTNQIPKANLSYQDYEDWKSKNEVLSRFDVWTGSGILLNGPSGPEAVNGVEATPGIFRTLGVEPALGRDFQDGEDDPKAAPVVILTYKAWQKRFGGRPDIIGQTLRTSEKVYTVIGVLPASFQFAPRGNAELWMPLQHTQGCMARRSCHGLVGVGRLKDGVSVETALANFSAIARQLEIAYPDSNRGQLAYVSSLSEQIVGDVRPLLLLLLAGAALLLVIACVNVSSLLLVRFESRRREVAVRRAMGASHWRLIRQFLTEGVLLVTAACVAGLALAQLAIQMLVRLPSKEMLEAMPSMQGLRVNLHVAGFAFAIGAMAACIFAVAPSIRLPLADGIRNELAEGGRSGSSTLWRKFASNLVVLELATAVILLASAGLLGKSFYKLLHVDLGFAPDHLAMVDVVIPESVAPKPPDQSALAKRVVERVGSVLGVELGSVTSVAPVNYNGNTTWIRLPGKPYNGEHNEVLQREVSSNYFKMLRAQLASGRYFEETDDLNRPLVAMINEALARKYFPGEDPLGKQIGDTTLSPKSMVQVVGVVKDMREGPLDAEIWPAIYYPITQNTDTFFTVMARTSQREEGIIAALEKAVRAEDPRIGTFNERTMQQTIETSPTAYVHRAAAWLVGGFASLALLLGVVGLYGVIAYSVSQRTREIGVRMALGAQRSSVYSMVLKEAGWLTVAGVATGLAGAVGAATMMRSLLFQVRAWDVTTLLGVAVLLATAALVASYLPARRAASVNPVEALRAE
ncbi:ABC efflux pump, inner membrane subunit [Candidatus Koribacter versatilis Ellin345]|uniref:ABC efflux pump, inner membrane subunit n=1 Tax=Koribacter versatilis (strain Ellin345) TaxID=204669 RepID=Q1IQF9_KORVE|nr:ABC transporter permease [Candidatus Koribacter versatilis]ABF40891.1 ABC efflux pump, inner membrane subunit [Candidatus Koribacter versatilis Ellin345]